MHALGAASAERQGRQWALWFKPGVWEHLGTFMSVRESMFLAYDGIACAPFECAFQLLHIYNTLPLPSKKNRVLFTYEVNMSDVKID